MDLRKTPQRIRTPGDSVNTNAHDPASKTNRERLRQGDARSPDNNGSGGSFFLRVAQGLTGCSGECSETPQLWKGHRISSSKGAVADLCAQFQPHEHTPG
jgi:hypothetical protein